MTPAMHSPCEGKRVKTVWKMLRRVPFPLDPRGDLRSRDDVREGYVHCDHVAPPFSRVKEKTIQAGARAITVSGLFGDCNRPGLRCEADNAHEFLPACRSFYVTAEVQLM
jgi:hypothetical protein